MIIYDLGKTHITSLHQPATPTYSNWCPVASERQRLRRSWRCPERFRWATWARLVDAGCFLWWLSTMVFRGDWNLPLILSGWDCDADLTFPFFRILSTSSSSKSQDDCQKPREISEKWNRPLFDGTSWFEDKPLRPSELNRNYAERLNGLIHLAYLLSLYLA